MRIPANTYMTGHAISKLEDLWYSTARQISMETGIYVDVGFEYESAGQQSFGPVSLDIRRIFFKVKEHEFESLTDLKKAIANKAFL